jgi:anti-anti-sigma regulatory factor
MVAHLSALSAYRLFRIAFLPLQSKNSRSPQRSGSAACTKSTICTDGTSRAYSEVMSEANMFNIHIEVIGDVAVVQCEGRIVQSDAAFRLRDAILSQRNARVVVVELSEVDTIEGGGLGMLAFLQRWAHDHNIKLKLFNPSNSVQDRLDHTWMPSLDVASTDELIALLDRADQSRMAA